MFLKYTSRKSGGAKKSRSPFQRKSKPWDLYLKSSADKQSKPDSQDLKQEPSTETANPTKIEQPVEISLEQRIPEPIPEQHKCIYQDHTMMKGVFSYKGINLEIDEIRCTYGGIPHNYFRVYVPKELMEESKKIRNLVLDAKENDRILTYEVKCLDATVKDKTT